MPWDDDIDIGVLKEEFIPNLENFRKDIHGAGLTTTLQGALPTMTVSSAFLISYSKSKFISLAIKASEKYGFEISLNEIETMWEENFNYGEEFPRLDVEFFYKQGRNIKYVNPLYESIEIPEDFIFPTDNSTMKKGTLLNRQYSTPADLEGYLNEVYPQAKGKILSDWVMGSPHNPKCNVYVRYPKIAEEPDVQVLIKNYLVDLYGEENIDETKVLTPSS